MDVNSLNCIAKQNFDLLGFIDSNKDNSDPFNKVLNNFKKQYKIADEHAFQNQYAMASLLYCLLVMREQDKNIKKIPDIPIDSLNSKWHLDNLKLVRHEKNGDFTKKEQNRQNEAMNRTLPNIIDQMRHAIAHGNIKCSDQLVYTMKNEHANVSLTIGADELYQFTRALTYFFLTDDSDLKNL